MRCEVPVPGPNTKSKKNKDSKKNLVCPFPQWLGDLSGTRDVFGPHEHITMSEASGKEGKVCSGRALSPLLPARVLRWARHAPLPGA